VQILQQRRDVVVFTRSKWMTVISLVAGIAVERAKLGTTASKQQQTMTQMHAS